MAKLHYNTNRRSKKVNPLDFLAVLMAAESKVEKQAQELFGDSEDCTDDEAGIIFNDSLTHAEKVAALKVLRRKRVGA